jgi:hypothetical protein
MNVFVLEVNPTTTDHHDALFLVVLVFVDGFGANCLSRW